MTWIRHCVGVICAIWCYFLLQSLRVLCVAPFGDTLHTYFEAFRDDQDGGLVILTHIYLLVGCSAPLWLSSQDVPTLAHYSGLISLGVGDTAASVIGSRFGRHHWTGKRWHVMWCGFPILVFNFWFAKNKEENNWVSTSEMFNFMSVECKFNFKMRIFCLN